MKNKEEIIKILQVVRWSSSDIEQQAEKICNLFNVSQQRELLNALADNFNESTYTYVGQPMIEETLKAFNCG